MSGGQSGEAYRGYDPRLGGGYSVNGVQTSHLQLARDAVDEWLGGPLVHEVVRTDGEATLATDWCLTCDAAATAECSTGNHTAPSVLTAAVDDVLANGASPHLVIGALTWAVENSVSADDTARALRDTHLSVSRR